jgi:hypothetical protein
MREDVGALSSPSRHETPPSEGYFQMGQTKKNTVIASFVEQQIERNKYESCDGLQSEAKPKKPR